MPPLTTSAVCEYCRYFSHARNASLKAAVKHLKDDFAREHSERVAVVQVASKLEGFKFAPVYQDDQDMCPKQAAFASSPRDIDERSRHLPVRDPNSITWEEVNVLAKGSELNVPPLATKPSGRCGGGGGGEGEGMVYNPMNIMQAPPPTVQRAKSGSVPSTGAPAEPDRGHSPAPPATEPSQDLEVL